VNYLAGRNALLVLDNLEQLEGADQIARTLIDRTNCTILATSRGPLRLRAEHENVIAPLEAPERDTPFEQLTAVPAVELFVREALFGAIPLCIGEDCVILPREALLPLGDEFAVSGLEERGEL